MLSEHKLVLGDEPSSDQPQTIINNSIPALVIDKVLEKAAKDTTRL
jgi:hypothetical protein